MDPIADMLNRIMNAQAVQKQAMELPFSKAKLAVGEILKEAGFIKDIKQKGAGAVKVLTITLNPKKLISGFKKVSKPGKRIYQRSKELKKVKSGYGIAIVSTAKGVLSVQEARKQKVGGELWLQIW